MHTFYINDHNMMKFLLIRTHHIGNNQQMFWFSGEILYTAHGEQITPLPPYIWLFFVLMLILGQVRFALQGYGPPQGLEKVRLKNYYGPKHGIVPHGSNPKFRFILMFYYNFSPIFCPCSDPAGHSPYTIKNSMRCYCEHKIEKTQFYIPHLLWKLKTLNRMYI